MRDVENDGLSARAHVFERDTTLFGLVAPSARRLRDDALRPGTGTSGASSASALEYTELEACEGAADARRAWMSRCTRELALGMEHMSYWLSLSAVSGHDTPRGPACSMRGESEVS